MKNKLKFYIPFIIFLSIIITSSLYFFNLKENKESITEVSNTTDNKKIVYLTFDDGPSKNTNKLLEILDNYNIKATFFVVGPSYTLKNEYLKKIVSSGHEIAIHSYEHNYDYIYSSKENYIKDFIKCAEWIKSITGQSPTLYRFPGGSSNTIASKSLIKSIIKELNEKGYIHADWNVDTLDSYVKNDSSKIVSNAITAIKRNENNSHYTQTILMHDDINKSASLNALAPLIEKLISYGYHFEKLTAQSHIIKHVNV
jgi:peptidoglycan/xylan/chitin deacetylase (PgdA/CDA1 family)